jgi:hypothetical protein
MILRLKTARTLRSIDNWKKRFDLTNHKFLAAMSILVLAASYANGEVFILALLILGLTIHYAAVQFAALILIGFFAAKLTMYRFSNIVLRLFSFVRPLRV